jgi:hypothetical protein
MKNFLTPAKQGFRRRWTWCILHSSERAVAVGVLLEE